MNPFLKNLNKIEFVVTLACTGRCKHCSEGEHKSHGEHIDGAIASRAIKQIAEIYSIKTVMAFGGEPLLCPDTVFSIISAARDVGIPHRQIITNGFFSKKSDYISEVVYHLVESGVNDLLLSVDAFHQETIPLEAVKVFADEAIKNKIPIRLQPAWLISPDHDNPYNQKTREILKCMGIAQNDGNIIFPEGNAVKYLSEYFINNTSPNPYVEDSQDVRCVSFLPNGDVLNNNVYQRDIIDILENYQP